MNNIVVHNGVLYSHHATQCSACNKLILSTDSVIGTKYWKVDNKTVVAVYCNAQCSLIGHTTCCIQK